MRVDATLALRVEEGAAAVVVGRTLGEQVCVMARDHRRLDGEDGEAVRAAIPAAGVAREPRAVCLRHGQDQLLHDVVQALDPVEDLAGDHGRSAHRGPR